MNTKQQTLLKRSIIKLRAEADVAGDELAADLTAIQNHLLFGNRRRNPVHRNWPRFGRSA